MNISREQFMMLHAVFVGDIVWRIGRFIDKHCDLSHPHDGSKPLEPGIERDRVILDLVTRARRDFDIQCERGMTQFVILGLGYSRAFHEIPAVQAMLTEPGMAPGRRVQAVLDKVVLAEARAR